MKKIYTIFTLLLITLCANAQSWSPVGTGVNSSADALNIYNGQLVAAGRYSSITKWNGTTWSDFSTPNGPSATSILVDGTDMYVGGQFTGGDNNKVISHYNGTSWTTVGNDISAYTNVYWNTNYRWWNIFNYSGSLYGVYDQGVLKYNFNTVSFENVGNATVDLGFPITSIRYAGTVNNTAYFSGMTDGIQRVITWDDELWDTLDMSNYPMRGITSMKVMNNELYIAGAFQNTSNVFSSMLKWNGSALTEVLPYGLGSPTIWELYATPLHLYARYTATVSNMGIWNGTSFVNLLNDVTGLTGSLNAVMDLNGITYAGGFFASFDGISANNIAQRTINLGTAELFDDKAINAYPNPVVSDLHITASGTIRNINIYNALGQSCFTSVLLPDETNISLEDLPSGIYLINVIEGNSIHSVRIVKQ